MRDGMIAETERGENFAYILKDKTDFLITEYKMMHGQETDFLLKCVKMLYNGKTELYYDTQSCLPLTVQAEAEDTVGMLAILENILYEVRRVSENGFLSLLKLDISANKIWIDPATRKVRFVYLPIAERLHKDVTAFEEDLRSELKRVVEMRSDKEEAQFQDFFRKITYSGYSSHLAVKESIGAGSGNIAGNETGSRGWSGKAGTAGGRSGTCTVVSLTPGSPMRLTVSKNEYLIGKSVELADGAVGFSKMISRKHCKIVKRDDRYAVVDLNSSNGTYLNGMRLAPGREYPIKHGDILRMATSDFQILIEP